MWGVGWGAWGVGGRAGVGWAPAPLCRVGRLCEAWSVAWEVGQSCGGKGTQGLGGRMWGVGQRCSGVAREGVPLSTWAPDSLC